VKTEGKKKIVVSVLIFHMQLKSFEVQSEASLVLD
jgi:hypothetical protein